MEAGDKLCCVQHCHCQFCHCQVSEVRTKIILRNMKDNLLFPCLTFCSLSLYLSRELVKVKAEKLDSSRMNICEVFILIMALFTAEQFAGQLYNLRASSCGLLSPTSLAPGSWVWVVRPLIPRLGSSLCVCTARWSGHHYTPSCHTRLQTITTGGSGLLVSVDSNLLSFVVSNFTSSGYHWRSVFLKQLTVL